MPETLGNYSVLDRALHRLAFAGKAVQFIAADIEDAAFASEFRRVTAARPIFVTSLPRAGTTILLSVLVKLPGLATHCYRDMPFVMSPLLWSKVRGKFHSAATLRERAHGDGIQISVDSPEAFEEVIWRAFWPEKYSAAGIGLWTARDRKADAMAFLRDHMRKIISLRCAPRAAGARYISKNNANIARLDLLSAELPDATIIVPVRSPLDHAASLLSQHRNFLEIHARDRFALRYMADIGHYEFGELHRPIRFPAFDSLRGDRRPDNFDYWLAYWIAAFEHVLASVGRLTVVSYDDLCRQGAKSLDLLCGHLGLDAGGQLEQLAAEFRPSKSYDAVRAVADPALVARADSLYQALLDAGITRAVRNN